MLIFGITGPTGAGKTSALRAIEALGALTLDCDAIYHELLETNEKLKADLGNRFGGVLKDGIIDRKVLREIVFKDSQALLDLNAIAHRYIGAELVTRLDGWKASGGMIAAIDAIALIESGRAERCDIVVGVIAPREVRIDRIMKRDGITKDQAEMRVNAQKADSFYEDNCDYILANHCNSPEDFEKECKEFFAMFMDENFCKEN